MTISDKFRCNCVGVKTTQNIYITLYIAIIYYTLKCNGLIFHPDFRETPLSGISSDISSPVKVTCNPETTSVAFLG